MSKAAIDAQKIKDLEAQVGEQALTIKAQADELASQINTNIQLRRELARAQANGNGTE